jgi:hypothetical protein
MVKIRYKVHFYQVSRGKIYKYYPASGGSGVGFASNASLFAP